ncbi:MAG: polymer-forming cytoskeletal protein [Fimbriimonadaceae bacterium]|nr:polymer-forming cytoskeletal protein [Chitinophagales bacterium]
MFGNKTTSDPVANTQKNGMMISNRINNGTVVEGHVNSDGDIRIEGMIRGSLHVKAKLALGPTGIIEGDVVCKNADIEGKIIGDIESVELLTLKASSFVEGNIYTNKIVVENGARFNGVCHMGAKDKKLNAEQTLEAIEQEAAI